VRSLRITAVLTISGCVGQVDEPPGPVDPSIAVVPEEFFPGSAGAPTPSRYWRLSLEQYDHAISELAGAAVTPSSDLGFTREVEGFAGWLHQSNALEADGGLATSFEEAATRYAPMIAAGLPSCAATDAACVDALVRDFGARAFRRPIDDEEATRYGALFTSVAADGDTAIAKTLVVEAMLRSPYFLFRSEVGDPATLSGPDLRLTDYELASALSFGLWNRPPDAELLGLAEAGSLSDAPVLAAQVDRLLADDRFLDVFYVFVSQWLGFHDVANARKDATRFPEFDAASARAMELETRSFLSAIVRDEGADFRRLFTADYTFPPAELDWVYGTADGSRLATPSRRGVLMQPSYLASHAGPNGTSPTARGVFVVRRVACYEPPRPDDDLVGMTPEPDPTLTTRQAFERHKADPACAACHALFDPIGVTFENFDAVGRFRATENGLPIDPSGEMAAGVLSQDAESFADARDLADTLAQTPRVHQCVVRKAFQYFAGREDVPTDDPVLREAMSRFIDSSYDLRALVRALFTNPRIAIRRTSP
jgi:hypothetical protein